MIKKIKFKGTVSVLFQVTHHAQMATPDSHRYS